MKVLLFNDSFFPVVGGITQVVDATATILSKHAHVLVGAVKSKKYQDPTRVYNTIRCKGFYGKITKDGFAFPSLDRNFRKQIKNFKPDIIHVHTAGNLMNYAYKLRKKFKIPVVTTVHSDYYNLTKDLIKSRVIAKIVTKFLLRKNLKADEVWAVSKTCKQQILRFNKSKQIKIVYNGTTLNTQENLEDESNQIKQKYDCVNKFIMSFTTRIVKAKNIQLIIDAMHLIHQKGEINAKIFLVGDGVDKEYFENEVKRLGLEKYFIFTGYIPNQKVGLIYNISDLVLFPSVIETAGLIQIEAAALSKPTLVMKDAAPSEMIRDGKNGLISENTPQAFAEKILFAYNNQQTLKELGANAKKDICVEYNDDYAKMLLKNYQDIITKFNN